MSRQDVVENFLRCPGRFGAFEFRLTGRLLIRLHVPGLLSARVLVFGSRSDVANLH